MRARTHRGCLGLVLGAFILFTPPAAHAAVTLYAQLDTSSEMRSLEPTYITAYIRSESIGTPYLGKGRLYLTFTMQDPHAGDGYGYPGGVALGSCKGCTDLQTYLFTDADRALLADGAYHTFRVETGTTTVGIADGTNPVYITFFLLSQYQGSTGVQSNAAGTLPYLVIEADAYPPPIMPPEIPADATVVYDQPDASGVMTNPQPTYQNAHIDSASLGDLPLGHGLLYLRFSLQDPHAGEYDWHPGGVCLQPATSTACNERLQTYLFTDADRALLTDKASHYFLVQTGSTTSDYADGTRPVSIGFFALAQYQYHTKVRANAAGTIPAVTIAVAEPPAPAAPAGPSSVLFIPGTEASRLYRRDFLGIEHQVWEPDLTTDLPYLAMNADGSSEYALYTRRDCLAAPLRGHPG